MLRCDICGDWVYLQPDRYEQLVRANELPRCRKNGCERLCGAKNAGTARVTELIASLDVPPVVVHWPRRKKGNANGALAKLRVSRDQAWRCR